MVLQFNYPIKEVQLAVDLKNMLGSSPDSLIVWWYCGVIKNNKATSQPRALVAFRKLEQGGVGQDIIYKSVLLTCLGSLRIGSVWRYGRCQSVAEFPERNFSINFNSGFWQHTSFEKAFSQGIKPPFPQSIYQLKFPKDKNILLQFRLPSGGDLLIPSLEFFSRMYGGSEEIKRILAIYGSQDCHKKFYRPLGRPPEPGVWEFIRRKRLKRSDNVFLAHYNYDDYTRMAANRIYSQIEADYDPEKRVPIFIRVDPWFQGNTELTVRGINFNEGKSFLGLQIMGYTNPNGAPIRVFKRVADGSIVSDGDISGRLGRVRLDLITPPDEVMLTDDNEPNHGGSIADIQNFKILVHNPGRSITEQHEECNQHGYGKALSSGARSGSFSTGLPQGSGGDIGFASIHNPQVLESEGVLKDVWKAVLHIKRTHKNIIHSAHWFTFDNGFQDNSDPKLIRLEPFSSVNSISGDIRNWVYIDGKMRSRCRGALVVKVSTIWKTIYIVEIERRRECKISASGNPIIGEEPLTGLVFTLDQQNDFAPWLRIVLSEIRMAKGVFSKISGRCPGEASFYKHSRAKHQDFAEESSINNALNKMGIGLIIKS